LNPARPYLVVPAAVVRGRFYARRDESAVRTSGVARPDCDL